MNNAYNDDFTTHEKAPEVEQALESSQEMADFYADSHTFARAGMTKADTVILALARLERVLQIGREDLKGVIDAHEFRVICNTFIGEIADPDNIVGSIASQVADDLGVEIDDHYEASVHFTLLEKLHRLTDIEVLALRDLVERFWYQPEDGGCGIKEFLVANGIIAAA